MIITRFSLASTLLVSLSTLPLAAADWHHDDALPRVGVQVLLGTSGFEPGIFAEWRLGDQPMVARPEVFLNEDERAGGGGSIAWEFPFFSLPDRHSLSIGPRVVYHNSDESGWEADVQAIWSLDLAPAHKGRHFLEVIGAVGALEHDDKDDANDDKKVRLGASIGIAYGYQF